MWNMDIDRNSKKEVTQKLATSECRQSTIQLR